MVITSLCWLQNTDCYEELSNSNLVFRYLMLLLGTSLLSRTGRRLWIFLSLMLVVVL